MTSEEGRPAKVYVEPTNACNLACATCVRHAWDEPEGFMEWATFEAVVDGLSSSPLPAGGPAGAGAPGTVAFMGLGEPLMHPRFVDMVGAAKERGLRAEVTTNALLLDDEKAAGLLEAGLDQLVVSIDGASAEAFGRVRSGASLARVVENVRRLHDHRGPNYSSAVRIGVEFVAMRSNIGELPGLRRLAAQLGATFIIVSNVLAYTPDMLDQTLYDRQGSTSSGAHTTAGARWQLPAFDWDEAARRRAGRGAHALRAGLVPRRRPRGHAQPLPVRPPGRLRRGLARRRQPVPAAAAHVHLLRARAREAHGALGGGEAAGCAAGGGVGGAGVRRVPRPGPALRLPALHRLRV